MRPSPPTCSLTLTFLPGCKPCYSANPSTVDQLVHAVPFVDLPLCVLLDDNTRYPCPETAGVSLGGRAFHVPKVVMHWVGSARIPVVALYPVKKSVHSRPIKFTSHLDPYYSHPSYPSTSPQNSTTQIMCRVAHCTPRYPCTMSCNCIHPHDLWVCTCFTRAFIPSSDHWTLRVAA